MIKRLSKNNKYLIISLCLFGLLLPGKMALAKAAFDVTSAGIGARPMGMGQAYTAVVDDSNALFLNPAGLGLQKKWGVTTMTTKLLDRVDYKMLGGVYPTNFGTVGVGYLSASTPAGYLTTDKSSLDTAQPISYGTSLILLSYGRDLSEVIRTSDSLGKLSFGLNLKMTSSRFEGTEGSGFGTAVDAGLLLKTNTPMSWGLNVQNIGGSMNWQDAAKETVPMTTKLGGAYNFDKGVAAVDVEFGNGPALLHGGLEYRINDLLTLRGGIDQSAISKSETAVNFTGGVGIKVQGFSFDYAYRQDGGLASNSTSYFSISYQPPILNTNKPKVTEKAAPKTEATPKSEQAPKIDATPEKKDVEGMDGIYNPTPQSSQGSILNYYQ